MKKYLSLLIVLFSVSLAWAQEAVESYEKFLFSVFNPQVPAVAQVGQSPQGLITFGAEKEGSSGNLMKVMAPSGEALLEVISKLSEVDQEAFIKDLAMRLRSQKIVAIANPNYQKLASLRLDQLSRAEIIQKFQEFCQTTPEPLNGLTLEYRKWFFYGQLPGLQKAVSEKVRDGKRGLLLSKWKHSLRFSFPKWIPASEEAKKYMMSVSHQASNGGWEVQFKPQTSFSDFQMMIDWFRKTMGTSRIQFDSPGHQWLVIQKPPGANEKVLNPQMAELFKVMQAYIVISALEGNTGILRSKVKNKTVASDELFNKIFSGEKSETQRMIFRFAGSRFGENSLAIEMRTGTKDSYTRNLVLINFLSRLTSQDFSGLRGGNDWTLIGPDNMSEKQIDQFHATDLEARFDVSREMADRFVDVIKKLEYDVNQDQEPTRMFNRTMLVPLWHWENAPFLTAQKKRHLKEMTAKLIQEVASLNPSDRSTLDRVEFALSKWAQASSLKRDIESYSKPKRDDKKAQIYLKGQDPLTKKANQVDIGLEMTAGFPVQSGSEYSDEMADQKKHWLETVFDMSFQEKDELLKKVAFSLSNRLNNGVPQIPVRKDNVNGHGHTLGINYSFQDPKGRTWRVEIDGVTRNYDQNGNVVPGSIRGGHVEIVTPKFLPEIQELNAVYETMNEFGLRPRRSVGGGHINVDLAPFQGNPEAMARFIKLFIKHRKSITALFQNVRRMNSAKPFVLTKENVQKLKEFSDQDEKDLMKLLYEGEFFNTTALRKTRYSQVDLTSYFQDVIPPEIARGDFDVKNPTQAWQPMFRVNPEIRKLEMRLFNAPQSLWEQGLQLQFVRAMIRRSLQPDPVRNVRAQSLEFKEFLKDPKVVYDDVQKMLVELNLPQEGYFQLLGENLMDSERYIKSDGAAKARALVDEMNDFKMDWNRPTYLDGVFEEESVVNRKTGETLTAYRERKVEALKQAEQARALQLPLVKPAATKMSCSVVHRKAQ